LYQIVALIVPGRKKACAIHEELTAAGTCQARGVVAHTMVEIDDQGRAHFPSVSPRVRDVGIGLLVGTLLGVLGGPEGLLIWAVLGALVGSQVSRFRNQPILTESLQRLAAQMQPDSSAILCLLRATQVETLVAALAGYGGEVLTLAVDHNLSGEISQAAAGQTLPCQARAQDPTQSSAGPIRPSGDEASPTTE
jgi:uncharacterized membrane protein